MDIAVDKVAKAIGYILVPMDLCGMAMAVFLGLDILLPFLKLRRLAKFWLFSAPIKLVLLIYQIPYGRKLQAIEIAMAQRYAKRAEDGGKEIFDGHNAVSYSDRIIDRQINKARGILPFNSLMITTISFESKNWSAPGVVSGPGVISGVLFANLSVAIIAGLFISSILLLELFWVHWGEARDYETFREEMRHAAEMARDRSVVLDTSIILSVVCLLAIMFIVVGVPILQRCNISVHVGG